MLPDFSVSSGVVQNHIHLGVVPYDGSAPVGFGSHGEPPYRFTVNKRVPKYESFATLVRSWNGKGNVHSLRTANNKKPIVYKDMEYSLLVTAAQLEILEQMQKQEVYLVDHFHCIDTADHTPFVKHMWFADLSYSDHLSPMLDLNQVSIFIKDLNTVVS